MKLTRCFALLMIFAICAPLSPADEGMWLFNNPPTQQLLEKYHFQVTAPWLEHLQRSSVRFDNGGSGSFVSPDGLVMTNQHVAVDCLQKMSTKATDYVATGFAARNYTDEPKCPDLELNALVSIEDVTSQVKSAAQPGMDPGAAEKARRGVINTIEKDSLDKTGLRSDVVEFYNGGQYQLYRYKRYTDVRLVFVPQESVAFFGGDPDNFEYPRYDLDICFFRVYENDKPAHLDNYLKWSASGAVEGDLIFVSGNPGHTDRLDTVANLEYQRDRTLPQGLDWLRRREILLETWSARSTENARRAKEEVLSLQNSRKALLGMLAGLQDPAVMDKKRAEEKALRDAVDNDPKLKQAYGDAWNQVDASLKTVVPIRDEYNLIGYGPGKTAAAFNSSLFNIAMTLTRLATESTKPNADRLSEYSDAGVESMKLRLFSKAPVYKDLETVKLADSLGLMVETLGADNELVKQILAGKSPRDRAAELIQGTKLEDVAFRKQFADGGPKAIDDSTDPMIQLARMVDPASRQIRQTFELQVAEPQREGYDKIADARFAVYGSSVYPDATFTPRLSFGEVKGYMEEGQSIPWDTTIGGTYTRADDHGNQDPFELPQVWQDKKAQLNLETPFNFVSTADIIGGNSGSPVVNRQGELVGIIFDGNIESLVLDYIYTDQTSRAVSVHSTGILEALRKIYGADALVKELTGQK